MAALLAPKKSPSQLDLAALALSVDPQFAATQNTLPAGTADLSFGRDIDPHIDPISASKPRPLHLAYTTATDAPVPITTTTATPAGGVSINMTSLGASAASGGSAVPAGVFVPGVHDRPITIDLKRGGTLVIPAPVPTPAPGTGHSHVHNGPISAAQADVKAATAVAGSSHPATPPARTGGKAGADGKLVFTETEQVLMNVCVG